MHPGDPLVDVDDPEFPDSVPRVETRLDAAIIGQARRGDLDYEAHVLRAGAREALGGRGGDRLRNDGNVGLETRMSLASWSEHSIATNTPSGADLTSAMLSAFLMPSCPTCLAAITTISPSISSKFSSSAMMPASIIRLMSSTVNARRGNPSAALVMATFIMKPGFQYLVCSTECVRTPSGGDQDDCSKRDRSRSSMHPRRFPCEGSDP